MAENIFQKKRLLKRKNHVSFHFHPIVKSYSFQYFASIIFPLLSTLVADANIFRFLLYTFHFHLSHK